MIEIAMLFSIGSFVTTVGLWIYTCYMDQRFLKGSYKLLLQMQTRTSTAGQGWSLGTSVGGGGHVNHANSNKNASNFLSKMHQDRIFPDINEFEKHISRSVSKKKDHVKFDIDGNEIAGI